MAIIVDDFSRLRRPYFLKKYTDVNNETSWNQRGIRQKVVQQLVGKINKATHGVVRATMEWLVIVSMKHGQHPEALFTEKTLPHSELGKIGGGRAGPYPIPITGYMLFASIRGFSADYENTKRIVH